MISPSSLSIPHRFVFLLRILFLFLTILHTRAAAGRAGEVKSGGGSVKSTPAGPTKEEAAAISEWLTEVQTLANKVIEADTNWEKGIKVLKRRMEEQHHKLKTKGEAALVMNESGVAALKAEIEASFIVARTGVDELEALLEGSVKSMLERFPALAAHPNYRRHMAQWEAGWRDTLDKQLATLRRYENSWKGLIESLEYAAEQEGKVLFRMEIDLRGKSSDSKRKKRATGTPDRTEL